MPFVLESPILMFHRMAPDPLLTVAHSCNRSVKSTDELDWKSVRLKQNRVPQMLICKWCLEKRTAMNPSLPYIENNPNLKSNF